MSTVKHPLEPLTADEVRLAVGLLKDAGKVTPTTRFVSVSLKEPPRVLVHGTHGKPSARRLPSCSTTAPTPATRRRLSLTDRKLLSWKHVPGVQPTMTIGRADRVRAGGAGQPRIQGRPQEALRHRRYAAGHGRYLECRQLRHGGRPHAGAWPGRCASSAPTRPTTATPGRSRGCGPVVDLNTMKVIRVEEYGHWPLPPQAGNYAADRVDAVPHRHQAAGDHPAGRPELRGGRPPGALAEVELRHRLQRPRRA